MWNEHFGISVVEGLTTGSIMVAHNSGNIYNNIINNITKKKLNYFYLPQLFLVILN